VSGAWWTFFIARAVKCFMSMSDSELGILYVVTFLHRVVDRT